MIAHTYLAVRPRPNFALVTRGFRERVVNLCPRISDWEVGATIIIRLMFAIKVVVMLAIILLVALSRIGIKANSSNNRKNNHTSNHDIS